MMMNLLAGVFLVIAAIISVSFYKPNQNYSPSLSKWFVIGFVSFGLFFFLISPPIQKMLTPNLCRAVIISTIFGSIFVGVALFELILFLVDKFRRKNLIQS